MCSNSPENLTTPGASLDEDAEPLMANRYESIPLPYVSINQNNSSATHELVSDSLDVAVSKECGTVQLMSSGQTTANARTAATDTAASSEQSCGDGVVVPASDALSVNLSQVTYSVACFSAKLKAMLLHKTAVVYKMLTQDSLAARQYMLSTHYVEMLVECCYAVCHVLSLATKQRTEGSEYPLLQEALVLAADVLYHRGMAWGTHEVTDTWSHLNDDGNSEDLVRILHSIMPQDYRTQFSLPGTPIDR